MRKRFWTIAEVMELCQVNERFLEELEQEELLYPVCRKGSEDKLFSSKDLETLRIAKVLIEDLGVNLAGVEIILRMRENMFQMRSQFDDIMEDLAGLLKQRLGG